MDLTGEQLGEYRLLRRLGRGAMAEVYLAEQPSLARQVALKVLNPELARDDGYVERFQHEARAAAALVSAGIVQIYEVGCADGYHFIAQEYVPGKNLGELIEREGRIDAGLVLDVLRQVAVALQKAAESGIVHRDIKPENIMLARSGEVKVADFGLARVDAPGGAKLTQVGVTLGTPLYMSPEQVEGRPVDTRSDLYSLGVTAYHMLAGEPPFVGENAMAVAVQHLNAKPAPLADRRPDVPASLSATISAMMAKDPARRPDSAATLLASLRAVSVEAVSQGWASGSDGWLPADTGAATGAAPKATAELSRLMRAASALRAPERRWRRWAGALAGGAVLGGVLAAWLTPNPLLAGSDFATARKEGVLQQVFHAKMLGVEDAWKAVLEYFPDAEPYIVRYVDQNLVDIYVERGDYDEAFPICERLARLGEQNEFHQFGLAGLVVCHTLRGNPEAGQKALSQFQDAEIEKGLEAQSPTMARHFREAVKQLTGVGR